MRLLKIFKTITFVLTAMVLFGCKPAVNSKDVHTSLPIASQQGQTKFAPGPKPPEYYASVSTNPVVSQLSFDAIAAKVGDAYIQSHIGVEPNSKEAILAYVFFDPLCPHCAKLATNIMKPDGISVINNIAWVPVGFLEPYSTLQGATLLSTKEPSMAFMRHENLVLEGNGKQYSINVKLATQKNIDKVVSNTNIWKSTGATQVPFVVTKDASGKTYSLYGSLEGFEMVEFLSGGIKPRRK